MGLPDDDRRRTPRDRFRNILSAEKDDEGTPVARKPTVVNLPRAGSAEEPQSAEFPGSEDVSLSSGARGASRWLPKFWTVGGILSIIANLVLLLMLISARAGLSSLNPAGAGGGALLGAYTSLEQLAVSHIRATIPVQTLINLDASVPVQTTTNITLAQDVSMQGAHVTINTALFNIDAPANITLPAGTSLDVQLDMILPMKTDLPISVDVPVDIPVAGTEFEVAIRALQDSLRPLLCAASPGAKLLDGRPICR